MFHIFSSSLVVLLMIRSGVATVERQVDNQIMIIIIVVSKVKRVSQSLADCPRWESEEEVGRRGWVSIIIIITHLCNHHHV